MGMNAATLIIPQNAIRGILFEIASWMLNLSIQLFQTD